MNLDVNVEVVDFGIFIQLFICLFVYSFTFLFIAEIPNFLSDEECDHIIRLAESKQFITSVARGGLQSMSEFEIPDIRSKSRFLCIVIGRYWTAKKKKKVIVSCPNTAWSKTSKTCVDLLKTKNGSLLHYPYKNGIFDNILFVLLTTLKFVGV